MDFHPEQATLNAMFSAISKHYDFLNDILSFGVQRLWRRALFKELPEKKVGRILDLCTGTGALLPGLVEHAHELVGLDICRPMMRKAFERLRPHVLEKASFIEADASAIPLPNESMDFVVVAFGVRNFVELEKCLAEIRRVLKNKGLLFIIELGQPQNCFLKVFYALYSFCLLPLIGALVSSNLKAYKYLHKSSSSFPCGADFERILKRCDLRVELSKPLSFGIAYLYKASK
ncbi:MAG: ubiquinone/menaquinone biosynthesis methyltransferase [SAR324 cluster bacterium]|uniref:Demethylmenaquinone methyltransferase n=1 Tax=SAR324 cluster bacterium TaxID=2024889 RepID=A0A7X9FSH2_9DELT|nr:ubiquinone/menaquinone biosynthesis methyltransferase [SAR324 cluster bacterium]